TLVPGRSRAAPNRMGTKTMRRRYHRLRVLGSASSRDMRPSPRLHQMLRGVIGNSHDRKHGIESAISHVNAAVYDIEIVDVVNAAILVDHGSSGIVPHAAGAGLMLPPAEALPGEEVERRGRAGFFEPCSSFLRKKLRHDHVVGVPVSGKAPDRNPPVVFDFRIDLNSG